MSTDEAPEPTHGDDEPDQDPGVGSGDGGDLGTPGGLPKMEPPSAEQDANEAVSGGGMVQPDTEGDAKDDVVDKP